MSLYVTVDGDTNTTFALDGADGVGGSDFLVRRLVNSGGKSSGFGEGAFLTSAYFAVSVEDNGYYVGDGNSIGYLEASGAYHRVINISSGTGDSSSGDGYSFQSSSQIKGLAYDHRNDILFFANDNAIFAAFLSGSPTYPENYSVVLIAGLPGTTGTVYNAIGAAARFSSVGGLAFDEHSRTLWVCDFSGCVVCRLDQRAAAYNQNNFFVQKIAGTGVAGFADGSGASAQFNGPWGLAIDRVGNAFVSDYLNSRIRRITPLGDVSTVAGDGVAADTDGSPGQIQFPLSVTIDNSDSVYIASSSGVRVLRNGRLSRISTAGGTGDGIGGSAGTTAYGLAANPVSGDLLVTSPGRVYLYQRIVH
jgi:hypothetical protein